MLIYVSKRNIGVRFKERSTNIKNQENTKFPVVEHLPSFNHGIKTINYGNFK